MPLTPRLMLAACLYCTSLSWGMSPCVRIEPCLPPPDFAASVVAAFEVQARACIEADPAHRERYERGLARMFDGDEKGVAVGHAYPGFAAIQEEAARSVQTQPRDAFLRECASLLDAAQKP